MGREYGATASAVPDRPQGVAPLASRAEARWRCPELVQARSDVAIRAVMFDFGGVISTSPFEAFARLEAEHGLPSGFIRTVNATNPDDNAWARLERNEIGIDAFGEQWAGEARALGHEVDGRLVLERLAGEIRPQMVAAIKTCGTTSRRPA